MHGYTVDFDGYEEIENNNEFEWLNTNNLVEKDSMPLQCRRVFSDLHQSSSFGRSRVGLLEYPVEGSVADLA